MRNDWLCLKRGSLLVDATCHVFNVLGFVLQAAVIVVGLHTGLDLTADGGTQLSAERAFLNRKKMMMILIIITPLFSSKT